MTDYGHGRGSKPAMAPLWPIFDNTDLIKEISIHFQNLDSNVLVIGNRNYTYYEGKKLKPYLEY